MQSPGLRNFIRKIADQSVAASTVLVAAADLICSIGASKKVHLRLVVPFTIAATGGFGFQIVCPAAPVRFLNSITIINTVTPGVLGSVQTASALFANALAVAGTHIAYMDVDFVNGTTKGNIGLQFACNSAANAITILQGATMEITYN